MRRIALVLAVGLPVRAEPSWHDPVLKKLGVNYTTYVANQVKKFDGHQHLNSDGELDMDFLTKKIETYHSGKFGNLLRGGVSNESMALVVDYLRKHVPLRKNFALCHGVNHGWEVAYLRQSLPGVEVWGTELAPLTAKLSNWTINWDFHVVKPEWRHGADFVYSNALDHSPNAKLAVTQWISEVAPHGALILEWAEDFSSHKASATDMYVAKTSGVVSMVTTAAAAAAAAEGGVPPFAVVDRFDNSEKLKEMHAAGVRGAKRHWIVVRHTRNESAVRV